MPTIQDADRDMEQWKHLILLVPLQTFMESSKHNLTAGYKVKSLPVRSRNNIG